MSKSDPFGFDMSVSSAKEEKPTWGVGGCRVRRKHLRRVCEHEGCARKRASIARPKAPDVLDEFFWFCKDHIREYNLKWNFFHGTTEAEMNAQMSKDKVWERETKSPFLTRKPKAWARLGIEDPHQVLGGNATQNPGRRQQPATANCPPLSGRAMEILEAKDHWTKGRYSQILQSRLIKVLHPDINGGDRSQEEQLQQVVWAWDQIKSSRNFK